MKIINYQCDFCGMPIDKDDDAVHTLHQGRIGYKDQIIFDSEDAAFHYHGECLNHLLCIRGPRPAEAESIPVELPEIAEDELVPDERGDADQIPDLSEKYMIKNVDNRKDLGKLKSLLRAGWSKPKIADEFGVAISTVYKWIKEIEGVQSK